MNLLIKSIALLIALLFIGCNFDSKNLKYPLNVEGVSLELATYRKAILDSVRYDISMVIPGDAQQSIESIVKINFSLTSNEHPLALDFAEAKENLHTLTINNHESPIDYQNEHILLPGTPLRVGRNEVVIKFTAGNGALNRNNEFMFSLFVPDRMRTFMPCFDQPDVKATFKISATVPRHWEVISNGKVSQTQLLENTKVCTSEISDTISTYLFSFAAGDFKKATRKINERDVNFYYRETDTAKINYSIDSVFHLHELAIRFMEEFSGIAYPFKKFDFIAIPDFQFGGMEHVGAIDYRANQIFLDKSANLQDKIDRAHLIAHETAHMWFGNLVTMKWFNDVWMKEVFANFIGDKFVNSIYPENNASEMFVLSNHPGAYSIDRTRGANPIRQQLQNLNLAGTLYGAIIYQKAPVAMRQLEMRIGEKNMQKGLAEYLKTFAFKNADWTDLISILDKLTGDDLSDWNERWINQPGRPVIDFKLEKADDVITNFTITQKAEYTQGRLKQKFSVALFYPDSIETIEIDLNDSSQVVHGLIGMRAPLFVLLNSNGEGYGLFRIDKDMVNNFSKLAQPVMRASACINMYENVIDNNTIQPIDFLSIYANHFNGEHDALILSRMIRQFQNIYWQFITDTQREQVAKSLEDKIFRALKSTVDNQKAKTLFQLYASTALSKEGVEMLYQVWKSKTPPAKFTLTEEDLTDLASQLAIRNHNLSDQILHEQLMRSKDPDRKARLTFLLPALSNKIQDREAFFKSITNRENRKKEVWVALGLSYIHHPLRASTSEKYLSEELRLLEEIRSTGSIFFPSTWLQSGFGLAQSKEAAQIVNDFLLTNPALNSNLRDKVLQETDDLFRAQKIITN